LGEDEFGLGLLKEKGRSSANERGGVERERGKIICEV
jgi:hypothetical protein